MFKAMLEVDYHDLTIVLTMIKPLSRLHFFFSLIFRWKRMKNLEDEDVILIVKWEKKDKGATIRDDSERAWGKRRVKLPKETFLFTIIISSLNVFNIGSSFISKFQTQLDFHEQKMWTFSSNYFKGTWRYSVNQIYACFNCHQ